MTTTTRAPRAFPLSTIGAPRLLAGALDGHPVDLRRHEQLHGPMRPDAAAMLSSDLRAVGLLGRGGAAFPTHRKLESMRPGPDVHVVVNGNEGEPASHKDRALMLHAPHLVLDGALTVARALATRSVTVAVRDVGAEHALRSARAERSDAEDVRIERVDTGFVGGEVRAMLNGLTGAAPLPSGRRVLPTVAGLHGAPTFASNVETFAQVGLVARRGPRWFAEVGTASEPGTTLVTMLGATRERGVVEVPHGTRVDRLVGETDQPVLLGGYHGTWGRVDDAVVDRAELRRRGLAWGAGVLAVLPADTCVLGEIAGVTRWLAEQSAGQCGPCLFGLASVADDVERLAAGSPSDPRDVVRRLGLVTGRGACAHPDGAARFVHTALRAFPDEVKAHLRGGCGRPTRSVLPTGEHR